MVIKENTYELKNGFMIHTVQFINSANSKMNYHISIIDKESNYNKEYVQTDIMPFWEILEEFTFDSLEKANEQFIISHNYYDNYER